jgi:hypothetical protein
VIKVSAIILFDDKANNSHNKKHNNDEYKGFSETFLLINEKVDLIALEENDMNKYKEEIDEFCYTIKKNGSKGLEYKCYKILRNEKSAKYYKRVAKKKDILILIDPEIKYMLSNGFSFSV